MQLGFACLSTLVPNCSPARTVTVARLQAIPRADDRHMLCRRVAQENLTNTRRLVFHCAAHGLKLYRITPQLVPLATHSLLADWDWAGELAADFAAAGAAMRANGLRISSHPGQYTVLNSPRTEVRVAAIADLNYHARVHELLDHGGPGRIILHVGGAQGGKAAALDRFAQAAAGLPEPVHQRLALENDDTVFGTGDVLALCQRTGLPMVLDIHHHQLLPAGADLRDVLTTIFDLWPPDEVPKIHVSSPRSPDTPRAHADYVDPKQFCAFLSLAAEVDAKPFDVMVEAKMKDAAALRLAVNISARPCHTSPIDPP